MKNQIVYDIYVWDDSMKCYRNVYLEYMCVFVSIINSALITGFQVQDVTMEIQDLLQWLEHTDLRLSSSKTVWGMPDSANERLNAHLVMRTWMLHAEL